SETEPAKLRVMSHEKLIEYEEYFAQQLPSFGISEHQQALRQLCQDRMDLLRSEIERRSLVAQSKHQHQEAFGIGKKTLFWARLAVVAAVVVPVGLALISQFPFSKLLPARIDKASPPTYRQMPAPTAASPEPGASSSTSTASP